VIRPFPACDPPLGSECTNLFYRNPFSCPFLVSTHFLAESPVSYSLAPPTLQLSDARAFLLVCSPAYLPPISLQTHLDGVAYLFYLYSPVFRPCCT